MSETNVSETSATSTPFHLPPSHPKLISKIPKILPHERVFPIQIGSELFRLSGASISSDAPSYFSQYFICQIKKAEENGEDACANIRTLYIDRDPVTFRDISLHLQGYHVTPRNGEHFVRLFADAQFYTLPKLMSQLYEDSIFVSIGHKEFQIPRDIFAGSGNSPNFFSLGFAIFFTTPDQVFPGLPREGLIRPPSIVPPSIDNRSAEVFAELLHMLRGYPLRIRDDDHRATLLRDCRYFNFKGVEQKLIPHSISYNQVRQRSEIVLRLEDILKSGISIAHDPVSSHGGGDLGSLSGSGTSSSSSSSWVNYARPYTDDSASELILEIGGENTKLHLNGGGHSTPRAEFFGQTRTRVARLFEVVAAKLGLPPTTQPLGLLMAQGGAASQPATPGNTPLSEDLVRVLIEPDAYIELDGKPYPNTYTESGNEDLVAAYSTNLSLAPAGGGGESPSSSLGGPTRKRRRLDVGGFGVGGGAVGPSGGGVDEWVVRKGQWRLKIQGLRNGKNSVECVLVAVRLEAFTNEQARNAGRGFLN